MDVLIGKDSRAVAQARSVAGPDVDRIKGDIRNIIQLIVVDKDGKIAAFNEVRRGSDTETEVELKIESIPFGEKYYFLLLMGHRERNVDHTTRAYRERVNRPGDCTKKDTG